MKILSSEITPYKVYRNRRKFIKEAFMVSCASLFTRSTFGYHETSNNHLSSQLDVRDKINTYEEITNYNNYYEFGSKKFNSRSPALIG